MFSKKGNNIFYNNSEFEFKTRVKSVTDIITKDNRKYINVSVLDDLTLLKELDMFFISKINNYESFIFDNNKMFIKLPFRYKRYNIKFNNINTCEVFEKDIEFKCKIKFGGFVNLQRVCFKIIEVY